MADSDDNLLDALKNARPSWDRASPTPDVINYRPAVLAPSAYPTKSSRSIMDYAPPFPEATGAETSDTPDDTTAESNEYGFQLDLDSVDQKAYTIDIHVAYGEILGVPPDGMTTTDDYFLTIPGADDGTIIYAVVTYNTTTLAVTSRTLAFGLTLPDSSFGTANLRIGVVDISYGHDGIITGANPRNSQCGDINIAFLTGAVNAAPSVFLLSQVDDPQPIS